MPKNNGRNTKVTLRDVYEQVGKLRDDIEKNYVSKSEFWPVRTLVYGFTGTLLVAVIGAIVSLVVRAK